MQQESPLSESGSTPQDAQYENAASKITRKSHRKSRAGCTNCKMRRIKVCDTFIDNGHGVVAIFSTTSISRRLADNRGHLLNIQLRAHDVQSIDH